jgi:hypothetical protein
MRKILYGVLILAIVLAFCLENANAARVIMGMTRTPSSGGGGLPVTGQTTSYRTGDDGDYEAGLAFDFTDNGDNTVTDNNTGLMWIKDHDAMGTVGGVDWSSTMTWNDAIDNCEALDFAGHTDWRLPNIKELMSIVDYEVFSPAINQTYFPNTQSGYYWSGTTGANWAGHAWGINFYGGNVYGNGKGSVVYVRPVRSCK